VHGGGAMKGPPKEAGEEEEEEEEEEESCQVVEGAPAWIPGTLVAGRPGVT